MDEPDKSLEDGKSLPPLQVRPRSLPPPPMAPPLRLSSLFASPGPAAHRLAADSESLGPPLFSMEPYSTTASTIQGSGGLKQSLPTPGTPAVDSLGGRAVADSKSRTATPVSSGGTPVSGRRRSSKQQQLLDDLGKWEVRWDAIALEDCIGKGSFGKVYTARWSETPVAVKCLDDLDALLLSEPPETRRALLDALHAEAGLMAALRHPNVVAFMAFCAAPPAIITELCARGSLTDVIKAASRDPASLPWPRRLRMAIDAATGMHHLHSQSPPIVHRDLKSPNLLVDKDWNVKVADFKLSKMMQETTGTLSAGGTMANMNPRWLAPEVLKGGHASVASDVFAFGVVLWELLTWDIPWARATHAVAIAVQVMEGQRPEVPPTSALPGGGFRDLEAYAALMRACWAQEPAARPASFAEVLAALRSLRC